MQSNQNKGNMNTLNKVTTEYIEAKTIRVEYGEIYFRISIDYRDGEYWQTNYIRVDCREYTSIGSRHYYYSNEKAYRAAIKRWEAKSI